MKIKTQVSISIIVFVILAVVITSSYFSSANHLQEIQKKQQIIDTIEKSSFELYYLENDYIVHGGERVVERWNAKYAELTGQISELTLTDPSQQAVLNSLLNSHADLQTTFLNFVATTESAQGTESNSANQMVKEFTASTLTGHTQMMMASSSELSQMVKTEAIEVEQRTTLIISLSIAVLMIFVLLNYLLINRSVLRSISVLEKGTERIGSGDLDTKIDTVSNDEMGDLSVAITDMASNLKTVLTSKYELEKEVAERKQAEEALQKSKTQLRATLESTADGILAVDNKGKVLQVSRLFAEIWKIPPSLLESGSDRVLLDYVLAQLNDPDAFLKTVELLYDSDAVDMDILTFKDGRVLERYTSPMIMDGARIGRVWSFRDITERKRGEENLVASLKRVQEQQAALALVSFSPALLLGDVDGFSIRLTEESSGVLGVERASVWLFDNNGEELRCIDLYESSHNRHSRDLILMRHEYVNEFEAVNTAKYIDAHDPLTDSRTAGYVEGYLKPNRITSMLDAVIRVSGQNLGVLCFEHVDRPHHWESDEIAFACQLADQIAITLLNRDRKLAEEALRESEERYRNVVEDQTEFICRFLPDGTHIFVNDAYCRYFNKKREEIIGQFFRPVLHPEDREPVARHLASLTKEHPVMDIDQRVIMPDGSIRWQQWSDRAIFDPNGRVIEYQSVGRDITEQKELEKEMEYHSLELRKFSTSLAAANKKLTLLSSITRHDINNQMTVLQGYLTILIKKQTDPTLSEYFLKASTAAQRISSMIQFTKEYENIGVNVPVWQDCRTLVDTAAKEAPLGKVAVKNDLPSGSEVFADPLVVKVCYNLMDNAVRYGGKITTIRFFAEEHDGEPVVVCEDDGDGVVAGEKEKIFERGFGKNTGLGLALTREILDITGITIRETGEPGKGARFEMTVPKGAWRFTGQ